MKTTLKLLATILLITLSCAAALAQSKKPAPDPKALIGLEIIDRKYPSGGKVVRSIPSGFPEFKINGDVIKSGNNYTLISKQYKKYDVKTHQSITLILDAKATKFHEKLRLDMQQNCEHPTVVDTDKVRLFAFSKNRDADYCRTKTRDLLEAWTINFETGELKKIDHKGMSCKINYYMSGLGPKCKKIEGLNNGK